jgi:phage I-like protein
MLEASAMAIDLALQADAGEAEQWIHVLPAGRFSGRDGRGPYTLADADRVIAASRAAAGRRLIPIDDDHQIDLAEKNGQPAIAAGWIKGMEARADGIWALAEWTARAREMIAAREFRYLSPVFTHAPDGAVSKVLRAALTNNPNLDQLAALASTEVPMEFMAQLRKLLSLPADADEQAVIAKIGEMTTAKQSMAPDPAKFVPIGDFERVVAEMNRLNVGISHAAAADHVANQIRCGRMIPALRDWAITLCAANKPAFDAFIERTGGGVQKLLAPSGLGAFRESAHATASRPTDTMAGSFSMWTIP